MSCLIVASACLVPHPNALAFQPSDDLDKAEVRLRAAREHASEIEARLATSEARLATAEEALSELSGSEAELVEEIMSTESQVRDYVVSSYVNGGEPHELVVATDAAGAEEQSWRYAVLRSAAQERRLDMMRVKRLRAVVGEERAGAASDVGSLRVQVSEGRNDLVQATAHEREAEDALENVRQAALERKRLEHQGREEAERLRSRGVVGGGTGEPSGPVPAPGTTGIAGDPTPKELAVLAKIRRCESRGNYSIVSPSGKFRGAYQFDRRTWAGVDGTGDPAAAPPHEQDYRALMLYRARGGRPWPNCS